MLPHLLPRSAPLLRSYIKLLQGDEELIVEGANLAALAALASLALEEVGKPLLIITPAVRESHLLEHLPLFSSAPLYELPAWEMLPEEGSTGPSPDISGKRLEVLAQILQEKRPFFLVASLHAALQQVPTYKALTSQQRTLKVGSEVDLYALIAELEALGLEKRPLTQEKGHFSVRGGIIDLFPPQAQQGYRIELCGDSIEEIRLFDPLSQRSSGKSEMVVLAPASELQLLEKGPTLTLPEFLKDPIILFDDLAILEDKATALGLLTKSDSPLFSSLAQLLSQKSSARRLYFTKEPLSALSEVEKGRSSSRFSWAGCKLKGTRYVSPFVSASELLTSREQPLSQPELLTLLSSQKGLELHLALASDKEESDFTKLTSALSLSLKPQTILRGALMESLALPSPPWLLLTPAEWTHKRKELRHAWRAQHYASQEPVEELIPGEHVVHLQQGIGKFLGLEKQKSPLGDEQEYLVIEYAEGAKFFAPVNQAHLLSRYVGTKESGPHLSLLGSNRWQKVREQTEQAIGGFARELIERGAERSFRGGFAFPPDGELMQQFEAEFPFQETEDQLRAIAEVKQDMSSSKAMDRLICGDVGYGKTEVALRAAFKAVVDGGKQVAVLVPTTLLTLQHLDAFRERMQGFPLRIEALSRLTKPKSAKQILSDLAKGKIDILIGTHRILSNDIAFADLGLMIVDEEQRFGVRSKERLRKLKIGVDCLTLSATPIPRTLYLSIISAREISTIKTPPRDRLPIQTIIAPHNPRLIQTALLRELGREGQIFYIHNRIEELPNIAAQLKELVPTARIGIAHGQMDPEEVEEIFEAFKKQRLDLLLATTLIENGVDIPNANTILIQRADSFGLADLYQMRGRVGRSDRASFAYFLTPPNKPLPEVAKKRLLALAETSGYGGGMKIALRDLEIRGAGDLLGTEQSGHLSAVGFHLYCKLLRRAVERLKKGSRMPEPIDTRIESPFPARIPESYIRETSLRIEFYYRFGQVLSLPELEELLAEMRDRFGPPPDELLWLYHLTRLKLFATERNCTLLKFNDISLTIERKDRQATLRTTLLLPKTRAPELFADKLLTSMSQAFSS